MAVRRGDQPLPDRQFLTLFIYGIALASVVVIVGDLMTTLERYIRLKPGLKLILLHFVYRTPPFVYQALHIVDADVDDPALHGPLAQQRAHGPEGGRREPLPREPADASGWRS